MKWFRKVSITISEIFFKARFRYLALSLYEKMIKDLYFISGLWPDLATGYSFMVPFFLHLPMYDHHLG
jgi:hypothetical protein